MNKCMRCGHEWKPKLACGQSLLCPRCHTARWNTPRVEKKSFDPLIDGIDRNRVLYFIEHTHGGNYTAAAYHLGISYPLLARLIKEWKVIPKHIVDAIPVKDTAVVPRPENMSDRELIAQVSIDMPFGTIPPPHLRRIQKDNLNPVSDDEHLAQCMAYRKIVEDAGGLMRFASIHGFKLKEAKSIYMGEEKVPYIIKLP